MSGIGVLLDIGKEALLAQKYALDVVSHNIANVNTAGYTRQSPLLEAKVGGLLGGILLGRGVDIKSVTQNLDTFVENRLRDQRTELAATSEQEVYLNALESVFNENSGRSLSTQLQEFWDAWQDLSNNPSGMPERNILYEKGAFLGDTFQDLYRDMGVIVDELNNSIRKSVEDVNTILSNIAELNERILQIEHSGNANDLRDQRASAVTQLAQYMDIKAYEHEDGNLTVTTGRGYILVSRNDYYPIEVDGSEIHWVGSGINEVNITDMIAGGKLGGWLEIRDSRIPEYRADLDALAEAVIWEVNKVHSQGVGLEGFGSVTSTYSAANPGVALDSSGLPFSGSIANGSLNVWVYDGNGDAIAGMPTTILVDPAADTLENLADDLDDIDEVTATVTPEGKLSITTTNGHTIAFGSDTTHVLAALGINTFFVGSGANDMGMNTLLNTNTEFIAAGRLSATGEIAAGQNSNALAMAELQDENIPIERWTYARGATPSSTTQDASLETYLHSFIGSIGVDSQSIQRSKSFNDTIVQRLSETRDSLSAVSLDEEMTNLIRYQQAYAAAAKLVTTAEEMLEVLMNSV